MTSPFNFVRHGTKWALEGWSESTASELASHNIRDHVAGRHQGRLCCRSLDLVAHPAFVDPGGDEVRTQRGAGQKRHYSESGDETLRQLGHQEAVTPERAGLCEDYRDGGPL